MFIKNTLKAAMLFCLSGLAGFSVTAQTDLGAACGCPDVPSRTTTVNVSTLTDANGNLTADNTVLTCETIWVLDEKVWVGPGQTIAIAPGTLIKGKEGLADAAALIVSRGGLITAPGTEECPIVFTAESDPMDGTYGIENRGKWGGVVLLGTAPNNLKTGSGDLYVSDGVGLIEGIGTADPRGYFGEAPGMTDDNDNSGVMTYVSIRHAGSVVGTDNELNGLTLGSVGKGTTLHHIEVISNKDDGIEFFGGNVDLKYASVLFGGDDGFDWDLGWAGRGQFWVVLKTSGTSDDGDNGFESDGNDSNDGSFYATPVIYNATFIGKTGSNGGTDTDVAMELKEATLGEIRNCVMANYGKGVQFHGETDHDGGATDDTYFAWQNGNLILENNTFLNCGTLLNTSSDDTNISITAADETAFAAAGNVAVTSISGMNPIHTIDVNSNAVSAKNDLIPEPSLATTSAPPVDGFFTPADYRGAFEAGVKSWLSFYSMNAILGLEGALNECATDITKDGITNTNDFLLLLGQFGQSCN